MGTSNADSKSEEFRRVALPHLDRIHSAALYLAGDPDQAADLVQDTYVRAFRFFHRFEPGTNCRAWLLRILQNVFRNGYRSAQRRGTVCDPEDPSTAAELSRRIGTDTDPATLMVDSAVDDEILRAVESLPAEFRMAIVLVDLQELTYEEAAAAMSCPVGTIRSRLSRARALLAQTLREHAMHRGYLRRSGS